MNADGSGPSTSTRIPSPPPEPEQELSDSGSPPYSESSFELEPTPSPTTLEIAGLEYVIPLDFVASRTQIVCDNLVMDENGLKLISKAVEFFMRSLISDASKRGTEEITYDTIADSIHLSNYEALKDFFPTRIPYRAISKQAPIDKTQATLTKAAAELKKQ